MSTSGSQEVEEEKEVLEAKQEEVKEEEKD